MKIVEMLDISNPEKVFMGDKHIKLTLDTETGRVGIDTPAMFTDPVVPIEELMHKLEQLWQLAHPGETRGGTVTPIREDPRGPGVRE